MKRHFAIRVHAFVLALLFLPHASSYAAFADCTVSGQAGVIRDDNNNGIPEIVAAGDALYGLQYDTVPIPDQTRYTLDTGFGPVPFPATAVSRTGTTLSLPGFGLVFSQLLGNPVFNHAVFTHARGQGIACGTLVDGDGDGLADRMVLQLTGYHAAPSVLMDHPLQFYTLPPSLNPTHWLIPRLFNYASTLGGAVVLVFDIGFSYFVPINYDAVVPANSNIDITCPGVAPIVTSLATTATGPGYCPNLASAIPTATFWGYAVLTLLLMMAGVWALRRGGFGDDLGLRA